jgi:hypothetical protein
MPAIPPLPPPQILQVMAAGNALATLLAGVLWWTARSLAADLRDVSQAVHGGAVEETSSSLQQLVSMAARARAHMATAASTELAAQADAATDLAGHLMTLVEGTS